MSDCDCSTIPTNQEIIDLLFIIAPQFKTTDPVILAGYNILIDALRCQLNFSALGCCYVLAFANLLAHQLTITKFPLLGTSNSISEGQLSISSSFTVNGVSYNSTAYGQAYQTIISRYRIGAYVPSNRLGIYGPPCDC